MIIYYNPECSKCNQALDLLQKSNCEIQIRDYLKISPSKKELEELIRKLGCTAKDLVRKSEPLFLEKFEGKNFTEDEWLAILTANPILIERPIVVDGEKAIVGRPPVRVLDLIK